jgi:branched-subunit amino acid transport protein
VIWVAVLVAAAGCYVLKVVGLSVPARLLDRPVVRRMADLLPVTMLAALVATGTFAIGERLAIDARLAGLGAAVAALLLRAPFLVVVAVGAATTALVRLVG